MAWKTLDDLDLAGKTVLTRVDINVPMEAGRVTDMTRIERIIPTLRDILAKGGRPVLLAHFDRPKGKVVPEMSLAPLAAPLAEALGSPVVFCDETVGPKAAAAVAALPNRATLLLENTRFHAGEESNDAGFADALAALMAEVGQTLDAVIEMQVDDAALVAAYGLVTDWGNEGRPMTFSDYAITLNRIGGQWRIRTLVATAP